MAVRWSNTGQSYTASTGVPTGRIWSFTLWARIVTDRNQFSCLVAIYNAAESSYAELATDSSGTLLELFNVGTTLSSNAMTVGAWYRIGVTMNGTAGVVYFGAATGALGSTSGTTNTPTAPASIRLGTSNAAGDWFNGSAANLKVWQATLTAAEMDAELTQYVPIRTTNLLHWHPWVGADTADYSGAGNTLTGGTGATTEDGPPIPWTVARSPQPSTAPRRAANF